MANPFEKKERDKTKGLNPFGDKAIKRVSEFESQYKYPLGKNQLNRYKTKGNEVVDALKIGSFNLTEFVEQANRINNLLMILNLEYHQVLIELSKTKPDCKEVSGALILRFEKFKEDYLRVVT